MEKIYAVRQGGIYMASDGLYALAFKYKNTKLWTKLYDDEIFAVKFKDGKTGYISIMGIAGDYIALGLYIGQEGFNSYRVIANTYEPVSGSRLLYQEYLLRQDCLQCTFQDKDSLSSEEASEVENYAERNNIKLYGDNPYPQFVKYKPGYCPWDIQTEQEEQYMEEALKAAVALAGMLNKNKVPGIKKIEGWRDTVILLEPGKEGYKVSSTELPEPLPEEYYKPEMFNEINVAKLKNIAKSGVWECEIVQYPEPVCNETDEVPHFPMIFLAVESATGFILPVSPAGYFDRQLGELLDIAVEAFLMQNICPKVIYVRDKRSYCFLEEVCRKIKTRLIMKQELPSLCQAEEELYNYINNNGEQNMQDILSAFDGLMELSDEEIINLPEVVKTQFEVLLKKNILPEEISKRLCGILGFMGSNTEGQQDNIITIKSYIKDKKTGKNPDKI